MPMTTTEELETRLAYMDDAVNQLSDRVYAQARELDRLGERCRELEARVQSLAAGSDTADDDAPPHY